MADPPLFRLRCECGFVAKGSDEETALAAARAHALRAHRVDVGVEVLRPHLERQESKCRKGGRGERRQ